MRIYSSRLLDGPFLYSCYSTYHCLLHFMGSIIFCNLPDQNVLMWMSLKYEILNEVKVTFPSVPITRHDNGKKTLWRSPLNVGVWWKKSKFLYVCDEFANRYSIGDLWRRLKYSVEPVSLTTWVRTRLSWVWSAKDVAHLHGAFDTEMLLPWYYIWDFVYGIKWRAPL